MNKIMYLFMIISFSLSAYTNKEKINIYNEIMKNIETYHLFNNKTIENLGFDYKKSLKDIKKYFSDAKTEKDLMIATAFLINNLHNPHCYFYPNEQVDLFYSGIVFGVEIIDGKEQFYISTVEDKTIKANEGDILLSVDNIKADEFFTKYHFYSNKNNKKGVLLDIAKTLTVSKFVNSDDKQLFKFKSRKSKEIYDVQIIWKVKEKNYSNDINVNNHQCKSFKDYENTKYTLTAFGNNFCFFTSTEDKYKNYPVIKFYSFMYSGNDFPNNMILDYTLLKKYLSEIKDIKGLIIDLRENSGGNNPNWFLSWFALGKYKDFYVTIPYNSALNTVEKIKKLKLTGWNNKKYNDYINSFKNKKSNEKFYGPVQFFETKTNDNTYEPENLLLKTNIALLTSQKCVSSCDHFVYIFHENKFGITVGEPTAAGFTSYRAEFNLSVNKKNLGSYYLAFSNDFSGKTNKETESDLINIDYPLEKTFENQNNYLQMLIDSAVNNIK